jgi:predicted acyl esterase
MTEYFLGRGQAGPGSGAGLLGAPPAAPQAPDVCYHDPFSPVPEADLATRAHRDDVLRYVGPPQPGPVTLSGRAALRVFLSSSASHAHLVAAVLDVPPAGPAVLVGEAVAHAAGLGRIPALTVIEVSLRPAVLAAGHRLRLELFRGHCRVCPGPDTPAVDRVHHVPDHPSALTVPGAAAAPRAGQTATSSSS